MSADGTPNAARSSGGGEGAGGPEAQQQLAVYDAEEVALIKEQAAREEAEIAMTKAVLGSVFSVRKPRDLVAGTSSGLKTVAKGVGLGLASLVAQPYIGAKTGGAKGFIKGVGAGTLTCVASAVTGTVVGTGQIVRGVVNTPNAMLQKVRGQVWNSDDRKWESDWYSLPEEEEEVFGASADAAADGTASTGAAEGTGSGPSASSSGPRRSSRKVVDRSLYDLLDVPPEASDAEIRRAFYKKSLALHPDKNPDNPEATHKFQAVSDAYRILGDAERRRAYDQHGQDTASAGLPKIEPVVFFAALFGSHHFEPYIGRLKMAQEIDGDLQSLLQDAITGADDEPPPIDILKVHRAQQQYKLSERQRQVRCAMALAKRLDPVVGVEGEEHQKALESWESQHTAEIAKLAQVPCGVEMLFLIGWIYANRARQFFAGGMLRRVMAKVEGEMHIAQSKAKLAGSVGRTCVTVNGIMKSVEKKRKKSLASAAAASDKKGEDASKAGATAGDGQAASSSSSEEEDMPKAAAASAPSGTAAPKEGAASSGAGEAGSASGAPRATKQAASAPEAGKSASASTSPTGADGRAAAGDSPRGVPDSPPEATSPGSDGGPSTSGELPLGCIVMLRGLRSSPELNDEVGMVCGFEAESGRYLVQILPDVGLKKLRRDNLVVMEVPELGADGPEAGGAGASSGGGAASSSSAPPPPGGGSPGQEWRPGETDDNDMADAFKDCMPLFHDAFWSATTLDVEFTLGKVIQKVLRDMSVDKKVRRQRADALLRLGNMLQEPMKARRKAAAAAGGSSSSAPSAPLLQSSAQSSGCGAATAATSAAKKSVLARFKPRAPWKPSAEKRTQKAREAELKHKRMEAALAMMAAGASTEDVDEMAAARAAMEAEEGSRASG